MASAALPPYDVNKAWRRALFYFIGCWLIAALSGGLNALLSMPMVTAEQRTDILWWVMTVICFGIIVVGYGFIWPRGTLTHGRPRILSAIVPFGLLWGISEGLLFVSVWHVISQWFSSDWFVVLIAFTILSTFVGLWHALYWDIYVAPEHNIAAWNLRKVLLAHVPNLLLTLIYLTRYENMAIFVSLQATALLLSTYFMHFPAPVRR